MTTLTYAVRDSATMLRRDIRHAVRCPMVSLSGVMVPVLFLLLFAGVFGRTLRAGLGAVVPSGGGYIDYLTPGILLMTACSTAEITAVNVSTDMTEGIIARFRTMAIARASVLTAQVLGGLIRAMISAVLVVAVALALGFRPTATAIEWVAAILRPARRGCDMAHRLLRPAGQNPRGRQQPLAARRRGAVHIQRLRAHRHHASRGRLVRPQPALHADHPDPARASHRHPHRQRRSSRGRVVRRHQRPRLPVGPQPLQPQPGRLSQAGAVETGDRGRTRRSMGTSSLTIGQLAAYVGVTVQAIRHYNARGLLAEPARDASGYRRYGARAVVDLVRIKPLAEVGVPLARIAELLAAAPGDFAHAVDGIDRALGRQIRELQQRRRRLAQLTQGERL